MIIEAANPVDSPEFLVENLVRWVPEELIYKVRWQFVGAGHISFVSEAIFATSNTTRGFLMSIRVDVQALSRRS